MAAIIIRPAPVDPDKRCDTSKLTQADYMPFGVRHHVAGEINRLWDEFVNEMHDGPLVGHDVATKFWAYVTR